MIIFLRDEKTIIGIKYSPAHSDTEIMKLLTEMCTLGYCKNSFRLPEFTTTTVIHEKAERGKTRLAENTNQS